MHNFKYHSIDDLERLIEQLKNEIAVLTIRARGHYGKNAMLEETTLEELGISEELSQEERSLRESLDMLEQAENEILERTLLQADNPGGSSV